jgi:hypothetical protein
MLSKPFVLASPPQGTKQYRLTLADSAAIVKALFGIGAGCRCHFGLLGLGAVNPPGEET